VSGVGADAGILDRGIASGLRSAGQNLLTLPFGFANSVRVTGQQAMLGIMAASPAGPAFGKSRTREGAA
jgi:hypothetical protein